MQTDNEAEQKAAIARLVAAGKMTHEKPGQYVSDESDDEGRAAIPDYDVDAVRAALPELLQIDFDESDSEGCFAVLQDGRSGEEVKVPFGDNLPPTTEGLIAAIRKHFRELLDQAGMDETRAALAAFDDED